MKKIILLFVLLILFIWVGINHYSVNKNSQPSFIDKYETLKEPLALKEIEKDKVLAFMEHGSGILFFGFPECIWCQKYLPQLNEHLLSNNLNAYYYNIYVDKKGDALFYDKVANLLKEASKKVGENLIHYNNEGRAVIYMPLTLFIKKGEIIAFESESNDISSKDFDPSTYWTKEKKEALKERLNKQFNIIKEALKENSSKGCDNGGCAYK